MALQRIQRIIATAGITSRRKAESLITAGKVTVNGQVVDKLGSKADPEKDHIKVNGKLLHRFPDKIYLLLNKPKGYICTLKDPEGRPTVLDLVKPNRGIYPVGRLDFNTEGLLLLTNDGDFASLISSAGTHCPKKYLVKVRGLPLPDRLERLRQGVRFSDGTRLAPVQIEPLRQDHRDKNSWFEVRLHEGKNNQIKKMFDMVGHSVLKLRRTAIGFLTDPGLPLGSWRTLTAGEVKHFLNLDKSKSHDKSKDAAGPEAAPRKWDPMRRKRGSGAPGSPAGRAKSPVKRVRTSRPAVSS